MAEKEALLAKEDIEFARLLEKGHDVSPTKPEAVNQARKTPLGVREAVDEIEIVGELLEAAKMACGVLPSDASGPLRTLLSVIKALCTAGLERDEIWTVRELIEAASMACVDLPPREGGALRALLRVASGKLGDAKACTTSRPHFGLDRRNRLAGSKVRRLGNTGGGRDGRHAGRSGSRKRKSVRPSPRE